MGSRADEAARKVETAGSKHKAEAQPGDGMDMRERYLRLLSWIVRIALIGVAVWLVGTPLQSGAAVLLT